MREVTVDIDSDSQLMKFKTPQTQTVNLILDLNLHVMCSSTRRSEASLTNQNFGGGVVDSNGLQDSRAIVGHRHRAALPPTEQDLILEGKILRLNSHFSNIIKTFSVENCFD